ncbi:MAG TPA: hypothetical protein VN873_08000 [Candidatus Angelobacter sp.]|nr:hypothetical protein [Candidatus Angelobacter sp.]
MAGSPALAGCAPLLADFAARAKRRALPPRAGSLIWLGRLKLSFCFILITLISFSGLLADEVVTNHRPQTVTNIWKYIDYSFPKPGETWNGEPTFLVSGDQWGQISRGLRLDIMNIAQGFPFFKTNTILARLHRASGQIVQPTAEGKEMLNAPVAVSSGMSANGEGPNPQVMTYFPWGTNALEEAWIEVTIGSERYWLEIPYGFDRNPTDPLPAANHEGPPKFSPAMKTLTQHDHVVRWQDVHYELSRTQNGRELSLIQSNPFDAKSEVELYQFPKQQDLYSPHTDVHLVESDGTVVKGHCVNLHLDDNHLRRTDTFDLFDRGTSDTRDWGQIEITVGGDVYRLAVPSSLYKYVHGHAEEPLAIGFLSLLRPGLTLQNVEGLSRNYIADGIRNHAVSSGAHEYRYAFPHDSGDVTLEFDESNRLVSWK